jgi:hypothetical protein
MPAEPTIFCLEISVGAFVPGKMNSSPAGMLSQAESGTLKFLDRISFCGIVSVEVLIISKSIAHRITSKDLRCEERIVLGKLAVVKDQQEFDATFQTLERVRNATACR